MTLRRAVLGVASALLLLLLLRDDDPGRLVRSAGLLFRSAPLDSKTRRLNGTATAFDRQFFVFLESARRGLPARDARSRPPRRAPDEPGLLPGGVPAGTDARPRRSGRRPARMAPGRLRSRAPRRLESRRAGLEGGADGARLVSGLWLSLAADRGDPSRRRRHRLCAGCSLRSLEQPRRARRLGLCPRPLPPRLLRPPRLSHPHASPLDAPAARRPLPRGNLVPAPHQSSRLPPLPPGEGRGEGAPGAGPDSFCSSLSSA